MSKNRKLCHDLRIARFILEEFDMGRQCAFFMRILFASLDLMVMLFEFKAVVIEYVTCTFTCDLVIHI